MGQELHWVTSRTMGELLLTSLGGPPSRRVAEGPFQEPEVQLVGEGELFGVEAQCRRGRQGMLGYEARWLGG